MNERVIMQTPDNVIVAGTFVHSEKRDRLVILVHMLPTDRSSWQAVQAALLEKGMASLAIDLRGHGESRLQDGVKIDYHDFSEARHKASVVDIKTAFEWAVRHGFTAGKIGLVGASIGANLCLQFAADELDVSALVLLSPGENYHGVGTFEAASRLIPKQSVLIAASQGDDQESVEASTQLIERMSCLDKRFIPLIAAGHGTNLFLQRPEFMQQAIDWLDRHLPRV